MGAAYTIWGSTVDALPTLEYICFDNAWLKLLPRGSEVISTAGHGSSIWSQAGKIDVRLHDGTETSYFIKMTETPLGRVVSRGEYEATKAVYEIFPESVPRPVGWGTFESSPLVHFYMATYLDVHDEQYPPIDIMARVTADFHRRSQAKYPHGPNPAEPKKRFGFHVPTCNGVFVHRVDWCESWEEFFTAFLKDCFEQDAARGLPCAELAALVEPVLTKVCPRLLRPLETDGRVIQPTLLHGDMYHGNTARNKTDGGPRMFDCGSFWGHHEYEMHNWVGGRFLFDRSYVRAYFDQFPPSEPREEWPDRNDLYFAASLLMCSWHWPEGRYRADAIDFFGGLVDKFSAGYTGTCPRKGCEKVDAGEMTVPVDEVMS